ncbi:MAG: hydroxyglutarate oxidase [Acidobacteria bacterium SCN 69-37]|mgnify:CR=1 FL=1|nr:MAG: hydroxyglutarate oxidase [Acidobacteria bacterium SCN 69-37]
MSIPPSPAPATIRPRFDVGVIGGGILGLAVARRVLQVRPDARVTVLEKERDLARHQTGRNSGVVHAGIYYAPGSLKATLCRRGVGLLREFCATHAIPYEACGKLIVALTDDERPRLRTLFERATANGVPGVRLVGPEAARDIEPHAAGVQALHSPETAIVNFAAVTRAIAAEIAAAGARVLTSTRVTAITPDGSRVTVATTTGSHTFDRLVICAGLHSDAVARLAGGSPDPRIVPFRGEYYVLRPERRFLVHGLIYPVPDPRYPFLGVHLTKRHDGEVLVGPNAVLALAREGYDWGTIDVRDLAGTIAWPGFRRMARQHWRMGIREFSGSLRRRAFVALARQFVPDLADDDVQPGPAGVRAQAVARDGALVDDFRIDHLGPVTAVRNAPSPGATSSLAIAEHIVARVALE